MNGSRDSYFVRRMLSGLLWPSVISSFALALGGVADSLFVGVKLGEPGLAAVGFTYPVFMLINVLAGAFAVGGSIHFTRRVSDGEPDRAVGLFMSCLYLLLASGIIVSLLGSLFPSQIAVFLGAPRSGAAFDMTRLYASVILRGAPVIMLNQFGYFFVRADDDPITASAGLIAGNAIDVALSALLIIGFDMGVAGAAIGTLAGNLCAAAIYSLHFFKKRSLLRFKAVKPDVWAALRAFGTGFSSSSQYLMSFVSITFLNNLMMRVGGEPFVAVYNVALNVSSVVCSLFDGVGSAIQPLACTFFSEHNYTSLKKTVRTGVAAGALIALPAIIAAALFAEPVGRLFGLGISSDAALGAAAIRAAMAAAVFAGFSIIETCYFQSVELERRSLALSVSRTLAAPVLSALAFAAAFGSGSAFWWYAAAAELISAALALYLSSRKLSRSEISGSMEALIDSDNTDLGAVVESIEDFCGEHGANPTQTYFVSLVVEELCSAIIGNAFDGGRDEYIQITVIDLGGGEFSLHLRDSASDFNPFELDAKKIESDDADDGELEAIGVLMVKKKAKSWYYHRYGGFNTLSVTV